MSFTNAPVSRSLVVGLVGTSVAATLFDVKHYFYIFADSHIWHYRQLWRAFTYQLCFMNSSEVLFACMAIYNLRVVERMWGSRKFASFLAVTSVFTAVLPVAILSLLQPITGGFFNYLPAGPTALIFAILAQYHARNPSCLHRRRGASSSGPSATGDGFTGLTLSDKSYRYLVPLQLALMQFPASLITAPLGWALGYAWRSGVFPARLTAWRVPAWLVGGTSKKPSAQFEGLRRRLEDEDADPTAATATGREGQERSGPQRRTVTQEIFQQFL
ncbi:unnamed protein product [Parascedosporium putredinis]|uniref:Peptidase S54 rhomboid domain-containing protein n=1 Tax=Parascedosporium putredinis TaxID=1442378 RepID=A0A9P1M8F0_9PEZI|nr:unnamed protein product [Parascedosporium putredinis]CAI7988774.1 unnamed protein product [Parascedosporium putredinis]